MASKQTMCTIKSDRMHTGVPMSEYIARDIRRRLDTLPFAEFFTDATALVPAPRSSRINRGYLWVPQRLAISMEKCGLGTRTEYLVRHSAVAKSSISVPAERPQPQDHYRSMKVVDTLDGCPDEIVIVDDVITRGATMIGAAGRLAEAFPNARIRGFAALRAVSRPDEFKSIFDPRVGTIFVRDGDASVVCCD